MTPEEFRALRKAARMTQAEMAERLDVSRKTVVNYENGIHPIPVDVMARLEVSSVAKKPSKPKALDCAPYIKPHMIKNHGFVRQLSHPFWYLGVASPIYSRLPQAEKDRLGLRGATTDDLEGYTAPTPDQAYHQLVANGCTAKQAWDYMVWMGYTLTVPNPVSPEILAHNARMQAEDAWRAQHRSTEHPNGTMEGFFAAHPQYAPVSAGDLADTKPELKHDFDSAFTFGKSE